MRECSRAFTGWTIAPGIPRVATGRYDWGFEYREEDHDDGEKVFLGNTGRFDGEDIIDIICQQPATARFIARHLYNFFVADEAQVPAWSVTPPRDQEAIDTLERAFTESQYNIRSVLRVLFHYDFFKNARFAKIKSPAELVVSTLRLVGGFEFPSPGFGDLAKQPGYMGQDLLNPPSVEGWHTGAEWINSGALMKRVNFAAEYGGGCQQARVRSIVHRLRAQGDLSQLAADHPNLLCSEVPAEPLEAASYAGDEPDQFFRSLFTAGYTQWLRQNVSPRLRLPREQIDRAIIVLWVRACNLNTSRLSGRPDDNWPKPFFWDEELAD